MTIMIDEISEIRKTVNQALSRIDELIEKIKAERNKIESEFKERMEKLQLGQIDRSQLEEFFEEPYVILPTRRPNQWYVIVPKWINFQIGWLERQTKGYNIFIVNQYVRWFTEIPKALQEKFRFKEPLPLKVYDGMLLTGEELQETAWQKYRKYLYRKEGSDRIRIKKGYEFRLIAQMIEDGTLPFMPKPIEPEDLREYTRIKLRKYQREAWNTFLKTGAIGIFWAFGSGKSFFGLYALGRIKGRKLVIVPSKTLKEQWQERIEQYLPEYKNEIEIQTYHAYHKVRDKTYTLIIFDECLPYESKVLTEIGWIPIGEIVEKHLQLKVLTHKGRWKKIIGWHKIPLWKRLVKITHENGELICTEDHKILTERGWIQAKDLSSRDMLFTIDTNVQMQNLRKRISEQTSISGTLYNSTQTRPSKEKSFKEMAKSKEEEKGNRITERSSEKARGEKEKTTTHQNSEGDYSWLRNGRRESIFNWKTEKCEVKDHPLYKAVRVCSVEIFDPKKHRQYPTKNSEKLRLRKETCSIHNAYSSLFYPSLSTILHRGKKEDHLGITEFGYGTFSSGAVYGRWFCNFGSNDSFTLGRFPKRGFGIVLRMDENKMGIGSIDPSDKEVSLLTDEYHDDKAILENNKTLHHSINDLQNYVYDLTVEDDHSFIAEGVIVHNCQHLPANTFIRLATLRTKYRLGFSGSPFREDGRENYIIALTGFPVGMSWEDLIKTRVIKEPSFRVYILKNDKEKMRKLEELLQIPMKTIIFCDWIKLGEQISKKFNIPFIYGATKDRLELIRKANTCVVSRVGDEGLSFPELERVIEIAFLYGSRMQESQRFGRLMHSSQKQPEHIILMTEKEFEAYQKRLYAITERGFRIEFIR